MPAHSAAGRIKAATVGIRVGGDKARAIGDEKCCFMHHVPVVGAGFSNDDKIRVHIGNGKPRFIELVNERAFAHDIRFLTFLTAQKIGCRHC